MNRQTTSIIKRTVKKLAEMDKRLETILEKCIRDLKAGHSIEFCQKKNPGVRGLKEHLRVVKAALSVSKKPILLDRSSVWEKISSQIQPQVQKKGIWAAFKPNLRFAYSKPFFAVIAFILIGGLLNSTAAAALNSMPGQTLYPVKRTVEKIELTLTLGETKKTEVRIKHAEHRLTEAQALVQKNAPEPDQTLPEKDAQVVKQTINEMVDATAQVSSESLSKDDKTLLKKVVELTDKQEAVLADIQDKVSGDTKEAVTQALDTASSTKSTVKQNLAKLEKSDSEESSDTATSTDDQILNGKDRGENASSTPATASSTEEKLKAWGEADETTSTPAIILPHSDNDTTISSTPEILDLK